MIDRQLFSIHIRDFKQNYFNLLKVNKNRCYDL